MSAALQNDNTALARNWLSQLTGQDLSNLGSEQLASLAKEQLSLRNHSDMAKLCGTYMHTTSQRESRSLSLTDSYLIVRVADKLVAFESLKVGEIVPCCTYQKLQMQAGYFIGMTRIHGHPMALLDLAQLIGVDNRTEHCHTLSLVLELAQGQIALAFDEMVNIGPIQASNGVGVAHIGISTKANMKFASGHARHNNQDVLIINLDKMEQDSTIAGLIATGERVRAADVWTKN